MQQRSAMAEELGARTLLNIVTETDRGQAKGWTFDGDSTVASRTPLAVHASGVTQSVSWNHSGERFERAAAWAGGGTSPSTAPPRVEFLACVAGNAIACGGSNGRTVVVGVESGGQLGPFDHGSPVRLVAFSSSSKHMVTASDSHVCLWGLQRSGDGPPVPRFRMGLSAPPLDVCFDASQSRLAVTCGDGAVYMWDTTQSPAGEPVAVDSSAGFVAGRFFASKHPLTEQLFVTAERDGVMRVWDLGPAPRRRKRPPQLSGAELEAARSGAQGPREQGDWATAWEAPETAWHRGRTDVVLATSASLPSPREAPAVSPLEPRRPLLVATAAGDGVAHVLDALARTHLLTLDLAVPVTAVQLTRSGACVLLGDDEGEPRARTGRAAKAARPVTPRHRSCRSARPGHPPDAAMAWSPVLPPFLFPCSRRHPHHPRCGERRHPRRRRLPQRARARHPGARGAHTGVLHAQGTRSRAGEARSRPGARAHPVTSASTRRGAEPGPGPRPAPSHVGPAKHGRRAGCWVTRPPCGAAR